MWQCGSVEHCVAHLLGVSVAPCNKVQRKPWPAPGRALHQLLSLPFAKERRRLERRAADAPAVQLAQGPTRKAGVITDIHDFLILAVIFVSLKTTRKWSSVIDPTVISDHRALVATLMMGKPHIVANEDDAVFATLPTRRVDLGGYRR